MNSKLFRPFLPDAIPDTAEVPELRAPIRVMWAGKVVTMYIQEVRRKWGELRVRFDKDQTVSHGLGVDFKDVSHGADGALEALVNPHHLSS